MAERKDTDAPVTWLFRVQQFENRLAIHIGGCVESGNIQDGGGQVDVEDDVGVPGEAEEGKHLALWAVVARGGGHPALLRRGTAAERGCPRRTPATPSSALGAPA